MPSGQRYVKDFIIYAAMGIPKVNLSSYKLEINGLVEKPYSLSFQDLERMVDSNYTHDFHCVTRWSIKDVTWTGVRISALAERAGIKGKVLNYLGLSHFKLGEIMFNEEEMNLGIEFFEKSATFFKTHNLMPEYSAIEENLEMATKKLYGKEYKKVLNHIVKSIKSA